MNILKISDQLELFGQYQERVSALIGAEQSERLVNDALVLITVGGNDYVNNYFLTPVSLRQMQYNLEEYSRIVITEYHKILKVMYCLFAILPTKLCVCLLPLIRDLQRLHDLGARRVLVTGTGPIGCVPAELAMRSSNGECAKELQRAASIYNPLLVEMITSLNQQLSHDTFVAVNALEMQNDFFANPQQFGIYFFHI